MARELSDVQGLGRASSPRELAVSSVALERRVQQSANEAEGFANDAQTSADGAQTTADGAQTSADAAQTDLDAHKLVEAGIVLGHILEAAAVSDVASADAPAQTGSYVQADVEAIRVLANENKQQLNALFAALRTSGVLP